jgi:hypothetical protein
MDGEKTIIEIELLERMYALADSRPLQMTDRKAANQKHDEKHDESHANNLWSRLLEMIGRHLCS